MKLFRKESSTTKDALTAEWFSKSIKELRSELAELQEVTSNTSRNMQQRNLVQEDVAELKNEFTKMKLELEALRMRQETTERIVKDLRSDALQAGDVYRKYSNENKVSGQNKNTTKKKQHNFLFDKIFIWAKDKRHLGEDQGKQKKTFVHIYTFRLKQTSS